MQQKFISIKDAVEAIGVSKSTVLRLLKSGQLPSIKLGRRRMIHVDDLAKFCAGQVAQKSEDEFEIVLYSSEHNAIARFDDSDIESARDALIRVGNGAYLQYQKIVNITETLPYE